MEYLIRLVPRSSVPQMKTLEHSPLNGELPSPKGVALAILELCRKDDATIAEVARIAQPDPALASRLIRQANSAAHGATRPVASVTEAIMRLGMGTVRNLALGFSLVDQYQNGPCGQFDYQGFWSHSLLMGLAMQKFSSMTGAGSSEELFACGLLAPCHPIPLIYAVLLAAGMTRSMNFTTITTLAFADVNAEQRAGASALATMFQQVAMTLGVAFAAFALGASQMLRAAPSLGLAYFHYVWFAIALLMGLATAGALRLDRAAGATISGKQP